jgi:FMN phosphatase YigB (HAD superfamily)
MKYLFLDFDRTLFNTELFYTSLELKYVLGIQRFPKGVDFSKFIYPDVIPLLNLLKKLGFTICLVTFGERAVQEYKFQASGLAPYFKDVFYVEQGSKAAVIKKYLDSAVSCEVIIP